VVRADEKLTAFLELESAVRKNRIDIAVKRWHYPLALSPFRCLPLGLPDPLSAGLTVTKGLVHTTE